MQKEVIQIEHLTMRATNKIIFTEINFTVAEGDGVAVIGANGTGKSTLLKLLCGILKPTKGTIKIADMSHAITQQDLQLKQLIGYAPDTPPLYPNDTVYAYLQFIAQLKGIAKNKLASRLDTCLETLDLTSMRNSYIYTLSKGTQQRINLAQALIHTPKILILDEPTNALDAEQCENFYNLLKQLQAQKITLIIASHQYTALLPLCNYMLKIKNCSMQKIMLPLTKQELRETHDQRYYTT